MRSELRLSVIFEAKRREMWFLFVFPLLCSFEDTEYYY